MEFIEAILIEICDILGGVADDYIEKCFGSRRVMAKVFLIITIAMFIGLNVGIGLLVDTGGRSFWGWLLLCISVIYTVGMIVLKIISSVKRKP